MTRRILLLAALLLVFAGPARGGRAVTRCPRGTEAIETADGHMAWACVLTGKRYRDGANCPAGFWQVTALDPYQPFRCGKRGIRLSAPRGICPPGHRPVPTSDAEKDYECRRIRKGFLSGPRCPRGTSPVPTPGQLKPFRCVRREMLEQMGFERITADGYAFQIEMNYRFMKQNARVKEIPFFFLDRTKGESKLTLRIGLEALWVVWWLRISDALGRL